MLQTRPVRGPSYLNGCHMLPDILPIGTGQRTALLIHDQPVLLQQQPLPDQRLSMHGPCPLIILAACLSLLLMQTHVITGPFGRQTDRRAAQ